MNKKQLITMWIGIVVTVLMVLFPPRYYSDCFSSGLVFDFIYDGSFKVIQFAPLFFAIFGVALVTAGLIYTLRDKKPKDGQ